MKKCYLKKKFAYNLKFKFFQEIEEAIELADEALKIRPLSYEAYYARSKAKLDADKLDEALDDVEEGLRIAPPQNRQDQRVLLSLRDEVLSRIEGSGIGCSSRFRNNNNNNGSCGSRMKVRASLNALTEL